MSDLFFVCPEGSKNHDGHIPSWQLCSVNGEDSWIHLSRNQMAEYLNVELPEQSSSELFSLTAEEFDTLYPWVILMLVSAYSAKVLINMFNTEVKR